MKKIKEYMENFVNEADWVFKVIVFSYIPTLFCIMISFVTVSSGAIKNMILCGDVVLSSSIVLLYSTVDAHEKKSKKSQTREQKICFYLLLLMFAMSLAGYCAIKINGNNSLIATTITSVLYVLATCILSYKSYKCH